MKTDALNNTDKKDVRNLENDREESDTFFALNIIHNRFIYPYELKKCCKKYKKGKRCKKCPDN